MRKILAFVLLTLGLTAGGIQAQSTVTATVSWANVAGETGFQLERQTGGAGPFSVVATVGVDVLSAQVPGGTMGTNYCFRVITLGPGGLNSAPSPTVCSMPLSPPPTSIISINWTQP